MPVHPPAAAGLAAAPFAGAAPGPGGGAPNILFLLTDQERFFRPGEWPAGFELPAHAKLMRRGTTFVNHRIASCVCTPSRSVIYTGRHIQQTRMFDNTNFPWIDSLSTDVPTVGHLLRAAGYTTAYKGKWHLTKEFETVNKLGAPTKMFTEEMEAYGFSDYYGVGDIIAHDRGGYLHDGIIASMGVSWLRGKGRALAAEGKPWFLAVNLVNPHDVMFYDTDAPGMPVQSRRGLVPVARDPVDPLYAKQWPFKLPANHFQPIHAPGRPPAHHDFLRSHDALVGDIPDEAPTTAHPSVPNPAAGPQAGGRGPGFFTMPATKPLRSRETVIGNLMTLDNDPNAPEPAKDDAVREAYYQEVFEEFVKFKVENNESIDNFTYDKFATKLRANTAELMKRPDVKDVQFSVYIKDGKVALKARVVRA